MKRLKRKVDLMAESRRVLSNTEPLWISCILSLETSVTYIPNLSCRSLRQNSARVVLRMAHHPCMIRALSLSTYHASGHISCPSPDSRQPYVILERSKGGMAAGPWNLDVDSCHYSGGGSLVAENVGI